MSPETTIKLSAPFDGIFEPPVDCGALNAIYRAALPFPHIVLDDFLPSALLDSLIDEMNGLRQEQWRLVESTSRERVWRMRSIEEMGNAGTQLLNLLHSASFLNLLSDLTGIRHLLPDPYLQGAGYASMQPGDFFSVHSDRNVAYETGLTRRLALIVFLNKSWNAQFNGQLELWSADARRCEVSIDPIFNRTVIFQVAVPNYHGVPTPIACPTGRCRQSFIVYYHTVGTGKLDVIPRSSIFALDSQREIPKLLRLGRELTPPILFRALATLVRKLKPGSSRAS